MSPSHRRCSLLCFRVANHLTTAFRRTPTANSSDSPSTLLPCINSYVHVRSGTHSCIPSVSRLHSCSFQLAAADAGRCVVLCFVQFSNVITHTHGFVARDDRRREIVVAFRGSCDVTDMIIGTTLHACPQKGHSHSLYRWQSPSCPAGVPWDRGQLGLSTHRLPRVI
jgi:hypothetical protein